MAPTKRKATEAPQPATPVRVTRSVSRWSERVTRSSTAKRTGSVGSAESGRKSKKLKRGEKGKQKKKKKSQEGSDNHGQAGSSSNANNTIVIEHSTQGNLFKTRAAEVKQGLDEKFAGITVIVNPKKPRKGCFEIRAEGGEKFISLLKMKRPYKRLKDLDMEKVISDITDKIN